MVDVAEWPKWLNDVVTKLDEASAEEGPSASHGWALVPPTLRKELRDNCIELHQVHQERSAIRAELETLRAAVRKLDGNSYPIAPGSECRQSVDQGMLAELRQLVRKDT